LAVQITTVPTASTPQGPDDVTPLTRQNEQTLQSYETENRRPCLRSVISLIGRISTLTLAFNEVISLEPDQKFDFSEQLRLLDSALESAAEV
jgi:hypothetical protein